MNTLATSNSMDEIHNIMLIETKSRIEEDRKTLHDGWRLKRHNSQMQRGKSDCMSDFFFKSHIICLEDNWRSLSMACMLDEVTELISLFLDVVIVMKWNRKTSYSWDVCAAVLRGEDHGVCSSLLNGLVEGKCVCILLHTEIWDQCSNSG